MRSHLHPEDIGHDPGHGEDGDPQAGEGGVHHQQTLHLLEGSKPPEERVCQADEAGDQLDGGAGDKQPVSQQTWRCGQTGGEERAEVRGVPIGILFTFQPY